MGGRSVDGLARKTAVTTGSVGTGGLVEVTDGLTIASRIIARGHEDLADGDRIRVVGEEADLAANNARRPALGSR